MRPATTRAKVVFMIFKSSNEGSGVPPKMKLARRAGAGRGAGVWAHPWILLDGAPVCGRDGRVRETLGDHAMAKGQKRSGREPKKPKKVRPKEPVAASPFSKQSSSGQPAKPAGGKR